ncbi:hypothetical protein NE237_027361 [Protea cynaroides]|uniref:EF-hand domain-containing protein n=1 Tax=Protea cynaroides TaxID=273540 RepID=A0A9Q0GRQ5_9MAGN|nr:hypothetical protein NE237_027361 [Protea cynaroides]
MEEIRDAADAYYKAKPKEAKKAKKIFRKLDKNGDGKVSYQEYERFYKKKKLKKKGLKLEHFSPLDRNSDGYLDIKDANVLYYLTIARNKECDVCGVFIVGMFYACEKCYKRRSDRHSYILCVSCYRSGKFKHKHKTFLDNYVLEQKDKGSAERWSTFGSVAEILSSFAQCFSVGSS